MPEVMETFREPPDPNAECRCGGARGVWPRHDIICPHCDGRVIQRWRTEEPQTSKPLDFDHIARLVIQRVVAEMPHYATNALNDDIVEQLRQIWNARGAADRRVLDDEMLRVKALIDGNTDGDLTIDAEGVITALDQ